MAVQHKTGGICKKPRPAEGPYSEPRCYCSYCMERLSVFRWNARARVVVVEPCGCGKASSEPEPVTDDTFEPLNCWVKRQQEGGLRNEEV